ncbi:MAG: hypothetical protein ACKVP5_18130 [Aestuariivirga sp.]
MPVAEAQMSWELPRVLEPLGVPWAAHDQLSQVPFRHDLHSYENAPNWNATKILFNTELLANPLLEI